VRYLLGSLLFIVALNAFGGGYYAITGAKDVPVDWLKGTPFDNYLVPGIILFVVVGGYCLYASISVFKNWLTAKADAFAAGVIVLAWIIIQVFIIGYVSWLQPAVASIGVAILALSAQLSSKRRKL
jgi:hypothetical protein